MRDASGVQQRRGRAGVHRRCRCCCRCRRQLQTSIITPPQLTSFPVWLLSPCPRCPPLQLPGHRAARLPRPQLRGALPVWRGGGSLHRAGHHPAGCAQDPPHAAGHLWWVAKGDVLEGWGVWGSCGAAGAEKTCRGMPAAPHDAAPLRRRRRRLSPLLRLPPWLVPSILLPAGQYKGVVDCATKIIRDEGAAAMFRCASSCPARLEASARLCWSPPGLH